MVPTLQGGRPHPRRQNSATTSHPVHRGDVVVFATPPKEVPILMVKDLVKRVIGLPGETISSGPHGEVPHQRQGHRPDVVDSERRAPIRDRLSSNRRSPKVRSSSWGTNRGVIRRQSVLRTRGRVAHRGPRRLRFLAVVAHPPPLSVTRRPLSGRRVSAAMTSPPITLGAVDDQEEVFADAFRAGEIAPSRTSLSPPCRLSEPHHPPVRLAPADRGPGPDSGVHPV